MNDRERLNAWIDSQDRTVTEIAKELGVGQAYLSAVKCGSRNYGPGFIWRFRKTFGNEATDAIFVDDLAEPV